MPTRSNSLRPAPHASHGNAIRPKRCERTQQALDSKGQTQKTGPKNHPPLPLICLFFAACSTPITLKSDLPTAPADGTALFHVTKPATVLHGGIHVHRESPTVFRASVTPGQFTLAAGSETLTVTTTPIPPADYLRLDSPADQSAFRNWFTYLAEAQFFRQPLPPEIDDCAALIRYCYREALSVHNDAWIAAARLPELPAIPQVAKYNYPFTPLGPNLFQIGPDAFAHFADAETLIRWNAHFLSKDLAQAQPADILLFRRINLSERNAMPFHTMIFLGSHVVYHTGPHGEIRRPTVSELLRHPDPQWRPFPANANFLGIYRWNIL